MICSMVGTRTHGLLAAALAALSLTACGKPGYCADKSALQDDISRLTNQLQDGNVESVKSSLKKVDSDAQNVISGAKGAFPSQAAAMSSSVQALKTSVKDLGSTPTPDQLVTLVSQSESVVNAVNAFDNAASAKCG
jgi:archaellum component FlaC